MAKIGAVLFQYMGCGCEKSSTKNIESLPDELVFEILLRLPAEDIYDNAKLVCRRWYRTVRARDFVHAHLAHHSTTGLLVHDYSSQKRLNNPLVFVAMRQGRIEVSELDYKMTRNNFASCNGLIVAYHPSKVALQITNPATKQQFDLRPFIPQSLVSLCYSIAYSVVSMKYKVVHTYYDDDYDDEQSLRCTIATVGVDKSWRDVCTEHLSPEIKNHLYISNNPIMTEGFLHWTDAQTRTHVLTLNVETETFTEYHFPDGQGYGGKSYYSSTEGFLHWIDERRHDHVLTLNVETETFALYPVPQVQNHDRVSLLGHKCYLSTGKSLSFFFSYGHFSMDVWEMKSETGEWTKMCSIDFEPRKFEFERFRFRGYRIKDGRFSSFAPFFLKPVGWLAYREVVVLRVSHDPSRVCFAYNVLTRDFKSFELDDDADSPEFHLHTNNLVGLI